MNNVDRFSVCALLAASLLHLGCTSKKAAAEAQTAETFASSEPAPPPSAQPDAAPPAEAAPAEPAAVSAEDDTWTDEPGDSTAAAASPAPAADQPETRTMEVIRKFVLERREKVRPCYDKAQTGRPNFKGDVMMRFVLSPSGMVQSIEYSAKESTLYAPDVGACIAQEMKTWQFPASSRGMETKVGYPFNFNPRTK